MYAKDQTLKQSEPKPSPQNQNSGIGPLLLGPIIFRDLEIRSSLLISYLHLTSLTETHRTMYIQKCHILYSLKSLSVQSFNTLFTV